MIEEFITHNSQPTPKTKTNKHKNNKGIALIMAVIVITMVSILLTSYVAMVINERKMNEHQSATASAYYIAKAGLERTFFDLSCEYERDESWIDGDTINERIINDDGDGILETGEGMPDISDGDSAQSSFQRFYISTPFADGEYSVDISFVKNSYGAGYRPNRLWVRSTGMVAADDGVTVIDSVTVTQLAKVKAVALAEVDAVTEELVEIEGLYDTLDYKDTTTDSAVDNPEAVQDFPTNPNRKREIRIAGANLDEPLNKVTIDKLVGGTTLIIKGGYDYNFTDGSRDPDRNQSVLIDSTGDPVVSITGSGTVEMGGVRIE